MIDQQGCLQITAQVLRLPQVCALTGLCRSMIYRMEAEQRFPRRIKLGCRSVGWIEGEVQDWISRRIEGSRQASLRRPPVPCRARTID